MKYVKWVVVAVVLLLVGSFFHYTLPQHDVVRIADTYEKRIDFGDNSLFWAKSDTGNADGTINRDVFFVQAFYENGKPMVFRNEDTGWGWPPYFKFDTSNLQAEATDLKSSKEAPQWAVITHYGWRNEYMSIYPNAVSIYAVDSPDVKVFPWMNITIFIVLALFILGFYRLVQRFKRRRIDPLIDQAEEHWDSVEAKASDVGEGADAARGWVHRFLKRWFG
ncbi:MAG: DUF1523 family protein [Rhodobacteraceae bacterium]|nr:DUF1523 family protein [Paracoccaceae bacterium]